MSENTPPYEPDPKDAWRDLRERLIRASGQLQMNSQQVGLGASAVTERARLLAKRQGVDLALSYMDEWERTGLTLLNSPTSSAPSSPDGGAS